MTIGKGGLRAGGHIALGAAGASTRVTWVDDMELGRNPLVRWLGLAMDARRARNLERGLARLKELAERLAG